LIKRNNWNKGEKTAMPVTVGGASEKPKTERDVSVTITRGENITDSQQAILLGILEEKTDGESSENNQIKN
jgi:hypothetical protein